MVDIVGESGLNGGQIAGIAVGAAAAVCCCLVILAVCVCQARRRRQAQAVEDAKAKSIQDYETVYGAIELPTLQIDSLSDEASYDVVPTIRTMNMSHSGVISAAQDDVAGSSADSSSESSSGTIQIIRSQTTYESRID